MLHNAILMLGMLGVVKGFTRWPRGVFWSVPGMALMLATITVKENALFAYAAGITFGLFYMAVRLVMRWWPVGRRFLWSVRARRTAPAPRRRPAPATPAVQEGWGLHLERDEPPLALRRLTQIGGWFTGVLLGLTLIALVFGRLAGQADVELSITDPTPARVWMLARARDWGWLNLLASWQYWEGQHSEHRIEGPLHYHLPILLTYELPLLLLLYGGVAWDATGRRRRALLHAAGVVLWVVLWAGWRASYSGSVGWLAPLRGQPPAWLGPFNDVAAFLHIVPNLSMLFLGMLIVPLLVWSLLQVAEHRVLAAWAGWWAACSLFQYSSAGEKVPWLAVHITLPLYLAVAWVWGPLVSRGVRGARMTLIAAGLAGAAIGLLADVRLIRDGANPRERIVFNHTTNEWTSGSSDRWRCGSCCPTSCQPDSGAC